MISILHFSNKTPTKPSTEIFWAFNINIKVGEGFYFNQFILGPHENLACKQVMLLINFF